MGARLMNAKKKIRRMRRGKTRRKMERRLLESREAKAEQQGVTTARQT